MVGSGTIGSDVAVDLGLYRIMSNLKKIIKDEIRANEWHIKQIRIKYSGSITHALGISSQFCEVLRLHIASFLL